MSAKVSSLSAEVAYTPSGPAEVSALALEVGYRISYADAEVSGLSAEVAYADGATAQTSSLFAEIGLVGLADAQIASLFTEIGLVGLADAQIASLFTEIAYSPVGTAQIASLFAEVARSVVLQTSLTLTAISPASGWVDGGDAVTLTGTGFLAGARVTFGADPATEVVVANASTITCLTPPHTGGLTTVTVTLPDGRSDSLVNEFTYFREPGYACQDRFPAQEPLS